MRLTLSRAHGTAAHTSGGASLCSVALTCCRSSPPANTARHNVDHAANRSAAWCTNGRMDSSARPLVGNCWPRSSTAIRDLMVTLGSTATLGPNLTLFVSTRGPPVNEQHCTGQDFTALGRTALPCTALHRAGLHCTALHCTGQDCPALHRQDCTALDRTALHCTGQGCPALPALSCGLCWPGNLVRTRGLGESGQ